MISPMPVFQSQAGRSASRCSQGGSRSPVLQRQHRQQQHQQGDADGQYQLAEHLAPPLPEPYRAPRTAAANPLQPC